MCVCVTGSMPQVWKFTKFSMEIQASRASRNSETQSKRGRKSPPPPHHEHMGVHSQGHSHTCCLGQGGVDLPTTISVNSKPLFTDFRYTWLGRLAKPTYPSRFLCCERRDMQSACDWQEAHRHTPNPCCLEPESV